MLCAGNPLWKIDFKDLLQIKVEQTLLKYSSLSDFIIQGNYLIIFNLVIFVKDFSCISFQCKMINESC